MKARQVSHSIETIAKTTQASVLGDMSMQITGVVPASSPLPGHLAFLRTKSKATALRTLTSLPLMAVFIEGEYVPDASAISTLRCTLLVVDNPQGAFLSCLPLFFEQEPVDREIHATAVIHATARIGKRVAIGPYCVIGANSEVGDDAILHSNVTLYRDTVVGSHSELHSGVVVREGCRVGSQCIIHNHAVIGADGFGYLSDPKSKITKVPQVGITVIGNHVEIGVGSAIDRGAIGTTVVGDHTKIDNHVQIGHNASIGSYCMLCAQVGIAGSVSLGNGVVLGGGTGVADHVRVTSGVRVGGHSGVTHDIEEPGDYQGFPAVKAGLNRRLQVILKRLARGESP